MLNKNFCLSLLILLSMSGLASAQPIINGFTDELNDRFTNDPSFIGAEFDFSGVARGSGNGPIGSEVPVGTPWATLISPNVAISANHFRASEAGPNSSLSFYRNNDSNDEVLRNIVSSQRVGNTDLFLLALDQAVPADVEYYNFISEPLVGVDFVAGSMSNVAVPAGSLEGEDAFLFVVSPTVRDDSETRFDQAVGRNRISGFFEDVDTNGPGNDVLFLPVDSPGDPNFLESEARFQGGDSGAPVFIERNDELLLVGINSVVFQDDSGAVVGSGAAFIGNETSQINAFIQANAVPEPTVAPCLVLAGLLGLRRRRRTC